MSEPMSHEFRDESGRLIYRASHASDVERFKRWRDKARRAPHNSPAWWEAKDKIDLGPGNLVFSESGDIYGTRSPLNDKESGK